MKFQKKIPLCFAKKKTPKKSEKSKKLSYFYTLIILLLNFTIAHTLTSIQYSKKTIIKWNELPLQILTDHKQVSAHTQSLWKFGLLLNKDGYTKSIPPNPHKSLDHCACKVTN